VRWNHCLGAFADIAAPDAVDVAGRARGGLLDQQPALLAGGDRQTDRLEEHLRREIELLPLLQDIRRQILHAVIEAGDGDAVVVVEQAAQDFRQHPDRVHGAAAEHAGMQIAIGGGDLQLFIEQTAQRRRDRGRVAVPHAGVADQHVVRFELVLVGFDERHEILGADLLLTFDQEGDVDRQRAGHFLPGATGLDEGHDLALVVLGAARDDDLAAVGVVGDDRLERRTVPEIERIDRLHVVMAVENHMRPSACPGLADDGGMAGGRAHFSGDTEARDVLGEMLGRGLAVGGKSRIRRDRLDPQQREQTLQAVVEILVDVIEHRLKLRIGHGRIPDF
jgi:hypothetical protein